MKIRLSLTLDIRRESEDPPPPEDREVDMSATVSERYQPDYIGFKPNEEG